jgi:cytochrome c
LASIRTSASRAGVVRGLIRKMRRSDQPLTDRGKFSQPARQGGYRVLRTAFLAVTLLIVGVCPVLAQDAAAGEKDFLVCRACHQIGPGAKIAIGPVLNGIVGRKAGTYPGFEYSDANKNSGIVWTPEELDKYLTSPQTVVPHTKMIFPGLKDAQKRQDVIAFLEQYGPEGQKKQ